MSSKTSGVECTNGSNPAIDLRKKKKKNKLESIAFEVPPLFEVVYTTDADLDSEVKIKTNLIKNTFTLPKSTDLTYTPISKARRALQNETTEQRQKRLKAMSDYQKARIRNESIEERQRRLKILSDNQRRRFLNETPDQRELRLLKAKFYAKQRAARKKNIEDDEMTAIKQKILLKKAEINGQEI